MFINLPETNIAPENGWLEYYFPIGIAYFQVQTVSFREGNIWTSTVTTSTQDIKVQSISSDISEV